ncbi:MAG TPA: CRISPR-associated protein Csx15 [Anaerolineales bacterium]|nr:CRISPR-associated protein Csx15 [Anaerolineales bacterium]
MILLNFSHPFTPEQQGQLEALLGQPVDQVLHLAVQFDHHADYLPQLAQVMEKVTLTPQELQSAAIIVNLPSFNAIAALVLAELHGRMGYFPPILRMRPVEGSIPPRYEVAEVLNLQSVRDTARTKRNGGVIKE